MVSHRKIRRNIGESQKPRASGKLDCQVGLPGVLQVGHKTFKIFLALIPNHLCFQTPQLPYARQVISRWKEMSLNTSS